MKRALIVGCGYVGSRLARRLLADGIAVVGTTRDGRRAARLEAMGVQPIVGSLSHPTTRRAIDDTGSHVVFYLVPPAPDPEDPLQATLEATARAPLEAFVYASSSSVYGDRGGAWVDESSAASPESERGRARLAAERTALAVGWRYQTPTRICRITGIYGPGRTFRRRLESGRYRWVERGDAWVNRIHVDDLVRGLAAAWRRGATGRVYNLTDDEPHRSSEFARLAAELHGLRVPDHVASGRGGADVDRPERGPKGKRVANRRLREELGVSLEYPSYRIGLPAAVAAERH